MGILPLFFLTHEPTAGCVIHFAEIEVIFLTLWW